MTTAAALRTIAQTTDEALAPLYGKAQQLTMSHQVATKNAKRMENRSARLAEQYRSEATSLAARIAEVNKEAAPLEAIARAGNWNRYIFVPGGHVHNFGCSTLRANTVTMWLPEYSGADEAELVEDAGDAACTVCFPTAPVNRPSRVAAVVAERKATAEEIAAKQEAKAAKVAAAITTPEGKVAYKTRRAAENALGQAIGTAAYFATYHAEVGAPHLGIPMKTNDETQADHAERQAGKIEGELREARWIVALLEANGIATADTVARKLAKAVKDATKEGGVLPEGFGL